MVKEQKIPAILEGKGLPDYKEITASEVNENIPYLLKEINEKLIALEDFLENRLTEERALCWDEVMNPLHQIGESLRWSWGVISHLNGVCNSPELREAYTNQQPEIVRFGNKIGQSKIIYQSLLNIKANKSNALNQIQLRIIESELLSMNHRGVALTGDKKIAFNQNSERLAELSNIFSNHVLDATKEWSLLLTSHSEVEGLPPRVLETLAAAAKDSGDKHPTNNDYPTKDKGPWRLGLDMPSYIPFITYSKNRTLREIVYKAHASRASHGELANQEIIEEILILRKEQAKLLGYNNWAELSLASKMAKDIQDVENLLEELRVAAMPVAQKELKQLEECAKRHNAPESNELAPWDISFWSEKLRQEKFDLNQELLRPWFPLSQVLNGLFELCASLFDIKIIQIENGKVPTWHKDVSFYHVLDKDDSLIAGFYLDPFSRSATKRGGAWMDECLTRDKTDAGERIHPIAYLICNQTPPVGDIPSLMSFEEVETLFHEFGHGLQHMLTTVDYPQAAGINNVEWDAVELPSQFMENWCLNRSTIMKIARHWETGEKLPEDEFQKLRDSRTFNSGMGTLRQIHFALTDLNLHSQWDVAIGKTPDELRREIAKTTTIFPPIKEDQFLCAFSHIFAGGYAAGYYSYKWAEVLSADAFSAFEEVGLEKETQIKSIGQRFRDTILSEGGSRAPAKIFESFRGRAPSTNALIRHLGLIAIPDN
tara:strand:+ start:2253 stop:4391 length:2139 start_codon:yes stop_codon:yes gene_type:complete